MLNKNELISDKRLLDARFYIPIAIFHKEDGSIAGVRFWLFGNLNNRHNTVNYNLLNASPNVAVSGVTLDVDIAELKRHPKAYGVIRGKGEEKGYYYLSGVNDIAHIRADNEVVSDVMQIIPKNGAASDVVSLVNWKGFVYRVSLDRALAENDTHVLDGIGNLASGSVCLRGGSQYSVENLMSKLPSGATQLDITNGKETAVIQNMPRLNSLSLPEVSRGVYVHLLWQSQTEAFKQLQLPRMIMGENTVFSLCCHNYPNADLLQGRYSGLRLNEINILQAPELTVLQLMMMEQPSTDTCKRLMKGYYDPGVCHCEIYCAPKLRLIELLQGEGDKEYTRAAALRLGGMFSLEEVKVSHKVGVLELVLDDLYLSLNNTISVSGTSCGVLILDVSNLHKLGDMTINVDINCDNIFIRTTPRKSCGEGERLPFVHMSVGDANRRLTVNYLKGLTKIFVD